METFSAIKSSDYSIKKYPAHAVLDWQLVSSSNGMVITYPTESLGTIDGAVTINRASFYDDGESVNVDTGIRDHVLYRSIKQLFYSNNSGFISASRLVTKSIAGLPDNSFVVSIGQNLYGDRIKPTSFDLSISPLSASIQDDGVGNLYISQSGIPYYVGNIFYKHGIAVITHDTGSSNTSIGPLGLKIKSGSTITLEYNSDMELERHQVAIRVSPSEYNFSPFNPTIKSTYFATSSVTQSFIDKSIPTVGTNMWALYNLMGSEVIKPYMTTIGLYNDQYELLAIAKFSTPIQRTFETDQIFIVRFDLE